MIFYFPTQQIRDQFVSYAIETTQLPVEVGEDFNFFAIIDIEFYEGQVLILDFRDIREKYNEKETI